MPSTSVKRPPSADSTKSGKEPGQRVIHGMGTPASRCLPASWASRAEVGCWSTKRCSSSACRAASRVRSTVVTDASQRAADVLRLEVLLDPLEPALAAEARVLHAPERRRRVGHDAGVDADHAEVERLA